MLWGPVEAIRGRCRSGRMVENEVRAGRGGAGRGEFRLELRTSAWKCPAHRWLFGSEA